MKLEINNKKKARRNKYVEATQYATKQKMGQGKNQISNQKYLETNENGNTMVQSIWNTSKAVLRRKFLVM